MFIILPSCGWLSLGGGLVMYENGKLTREELVQVVRRLNIEAIDNVSWGIIQFHFDTDATEYTGGTRQFTLEPGTYLYCYMTQEEHSEFGKVLDFSIYDSGVRDYEPDEWVVMWRIG